MAKRPAPARGGEARSRASRQSSRSAGRRAGDAPPRRQRPGREQRPLRSGPQTAPVARPADGPARPKTASQAKARAKARKAKAPRVVRVPLRERIRERITTRLASIELNPRVLVTRVPFVVFVIGSLGVGLGVTLWLSTGAAERSYQLGAARELNQGLLQQKEALERDVLEAQAAPALAEAARELGMIPSRDTAHLVQDPAGNWVVVGEPKPAEGVPPPPLNTPLPDETPAPRPPARSNGPGVIAPLEVPVRVPSPGLQTPLPGMAPTGVPQGFPLAVPQGVPAEGQLGLPQGVGLGVPPGVEVTHGATGQVPAVGPAQPSAVLPQSPIVLPQPPTAPGPVAPALPGAEHLPGDQIVPPAPVVVGPPA